MQTYTMKLVGKEYEPNRKSKSSLTVKSLCFEVPPTYFLENGGDLNTRSISLDLRRQEYSLENYNHLQINKYYTLVYIDLGFGDKGIWFVITGDALDDVNYRDDLRMLTK